MSKEQAQITLEEPFKLSMSRPKANRERIGIRSEFPNTEPSKEIFNGLGLMYLVSPYLPKKITTDFFVHEKFRDLISLMYQSEGKEKPIFALTDKRLVKEKDAFKTSRHETTNDRALLTYSAGKDSMWNLSWLLKERGLENVLAVHVKGMNRAVAKGEHDATIRQANKIGFQLNILDLLNSSKNSGRNVMRSRDMLLVGITIPLALQFGAANIYLEGGHLPKGSASGEPFNRYAEAWEEFNNLFKELNIPVRAAWRDIKGYEPVKDLLKDHPGWLELVHNCFAPPCYKPEKRRRWEKVAPTFPLFETQCGSCLKCREVNIGRIKHDPSIRKADRKDIQEYIRSTVIWAKDHTQAVEDMGEDFSYNLLSLSQEYGLENLHTKYLGA